MAEACDDCADSVPSFLCQHCGKSVTKRGPRDCRRMYCSGTCKVRRWRKLHPEAEAARKQKDALKRRLKFQSEDHLRAKETARLAREEARKVREQVREQVRMSAALSRTHRICQRCGRPFTKPVLRPGAFALCPDCRVTNKRESRRKTRQRNGRKAAQRARRRGLPYERCGPIAICTRDKWHCQLCGVATPRRLRGTNDRRAPEIDHIIPLSVPASPGHVWSNVQCLCRRCNIKKGATIRGQLWITLSRGGDSLVAGDER